VAKHSYIAIGVFVMMMATSAAGQAKHSDSPEQIVARIQRADYQGDRVALAKLHEQLSPMKSGAQAPLIFYWQGFALWRRAINGFNESADRNDLEADLNGAIADFEEAIKRDPHFADAESAEAGCTMSLLFLHIKDGDYVKQRIPKMVQLLNDARAQEPDNPRVLWVVGGGLWYRPVESGGGQEKAIETYQRGLDIIHKGSGKTAQVANPLQPAWGEPELLMNLAWSNLNRTKPDLDAAEKNARSALALVPDWHYVRDILLPQIAAARDKVGK
jgi:tetratricopeptide (TPR) repeat protein